MSRILLFIGTLPLIVALSACASPAPEQDEIPVAAEKDLALAGVGAVAQTMQLTGENSPNRTDQFNVYGTDLGSMFDHNGKIYMVFGDTFGTRNPGQTGAGGAAWRSNALAYTTDLEASDGITFDGMITTASGSAKQIIHSSHSGGEVTKIPTGGVSANGNIYIYFMSVSHWGDAGYWDCNYSGVARSVDDGQNFEIVEGLQWPGASNFIQMAIAPVDDYLYFWAIPGGRHGGVQLMRVPMSGVEELADYEYFSGVRRNMAMWDEEMEVAHTVVEGPVGELSVIWNDYLDRWIMTYLNERSHAIEIREAREPWGPWSEPLALARASQYPALYGAYMHPTYVEDAGRVIYFTMSQWMPYNVFLMRAELEMRQ